MNSDNLNVITFDTKSKRTPTKQNQEEEHPQFLNQHQQMILNNLIKIN